MSKQKTDNQGEEKKEEKNNIIKNTLLSPLLWINVAALCFYLENLDRPLKIGVVFNWLIIISVVFQTIDSFYYAKKTTKFFVSFFLSLLLKVFIISFFLGWTMFLPLGIFLYVAVFILVFVIFKNLMKLPKFSNKKINIKLKSLPMFIGHILLVLFVGVGGFIMAFAAAMMESDEYGRNVMIVYFTFLVIINSVSSYWFSRRQPKRWQSFLVLFLFWPVMIAIIFLMYMILGEY